MKKVDLISTLINYFVLVFKFFSKKVREIAYTSSADLFLLYLFYIFYLFLYFNYCPSRYTRDDGFGQIKFAPDKRNKSCLHI